MSPERFATYVSERSVVQNAGIVGDAGERISNIRDLWRAGLRGEQTALNIVRENGYTVVGVQVYVRTQIGLRITDMKWYGPHGLTGFEVKTGLTSSYNSLQ